MVDLNPSKDIVSKKCKIWRRAFSNINMDDQPNTKILKLKIGKINLTCDCFFVVTASWMLQNLHANS